MANVISPGDAFKRVALGCSGLRYAVDSWRGVRLALCVDGCAVGRLSGAERCWQWLRRSLIHASILLDARSSAELGGTPFPVGLPHGVLG